MAQRWEDTDAAWTPSQTSTVKAIQSVGEMFAIGQKLGWQVTRDGDNLFVYTKDKYRVVIEGRVGTTFKGTERGIEVTKDEALAFLRHQCECSSGEAYFPYEHDLMKLDPDCASHGRYAKWGGERKPA